MMRFIFGEVKSGRAWLHFPVGAFNVFLAYTNWVVALLFLVGFFLYELNEDMHLKDKAYLDIKGYCWGVALAGFIWAWL